MTVLIVTHSDDNDSVDRVARGLEARGASVFRLDTDTFPTETRLVVRYDGDAEEVTLRRGDDAVRLDEVSAVWYRRIAIGARIPEEMEEQLRRASIEESRRTLLGLITSLPCFVMDPLANVRRAESKQLQLRLAREIGFDTPRTLITNDAEAVREFAAACGGEIITKMQASFAIYDEGEEQVVFTNRIGVGDLDDLSGLQYAPMTFQECLTKSVELRTTVVGDRIFTAAVDSQRLGRARDDWRREGVALLADWRASDLDGATEAKVRRLLDTLGLRYGALDFVVTPEGRTVFLEINPVGEFFWLEDHPGFPLSEAIAEELVARAR